jgi:hypothetical protein
MHIIEAPYLTPILPASLFLAGGISNCLNWQAEAITLLAKVEGTAFNPRRSVEFTAEIASEQIEWEHNALRNSQALLFWFPAETLCPITLFELGVFSQRLDIPLFVGTHSDYQRRFDVIKQLELERPEVQVHDKLENVISEFIRWQTAR